MHLTKLHPIFSSKDLAKIKIIKKIPLYFIDYTLMYVFYYFSLLYIDAILYLKLFLNISNYFTTTKYN